MGFPLFLCSCSIHPTRHYVHLQKNPGSHRRQPDRAIGRRPGLCAGARPAGRHSLRGGGGERTAEFLPGISQCAGQRCPAIARPLGE